MNTSYLSIFILLLFQTSSSFYCEEQDYQQYFSPCDSKTNTRTVSIYLTKKCTTPPNPSPLLSIYSTLPIFTTNCGTKCPEGTIIHYDPLTKSNTCQKCPENTYSTGGNFKEFEDWTESSLEAFQTHCFVYDINNHKTDEECTTLHISEDGTMLTSGEIIGNQIKYEMRAIYFFNAKNNGKIMLQYKKDSYREQTYNNGEFKILFDFEPIVEDNELNTSWKTILHEFESGKHEIVFFYTYNKTSQTNNLKFYIKSFEILGIDDAAYECKQCINSVAPEGSNKCISCSVNHYYDIHSQKCLECSQEQYSIPSILNYANNCLQKVTCSRYDYKILNVTECIDGEKQVTYSSLQPSYCLDESKINKIKYYPCDNKSYTKNNYEITSRLFNNNDIKTICDNGYVITSVFKLDLIDEDIEEFWTYEKGWKNNGKELYTGLYLVKPVEMVLTKTFTLKYPQHAYINILFSIDLDNSEIFKIIIGQDTILYSNTKEENMIITLQIKQLSNQNNITFIYEKKSNFLKETNAVSIKHIEIYGSDLSDETKYIRCPKGTISNKEEGCFKCIECDENSIPNKEQTECIKCNNIISYNGDYICGDCPSYTYLSEGKCILYEVLHQHKEKLKFNLKQMKDWIQRLCHDQSGLLCYDNAFVGPIINNVLPLSNKRDENVRDLFFLSLFEPKIGNINDFTYDESYSKYKHGHIFGLFSVNNFNVYNDKTTTNGGILISNNITYQNIKIKQNIAPRISKVNLLSNKQSILIEYKEGDICLNDISKRYKSYLYLNCYKNKISAPKLVNATDNQCTFIFEWNSPFICRNCIVKELQNFEVGTCKNGLRQIIFTANNNCSIFNGSNPMLIGYDKIFNDTLLNNSDLIIDFNQVRSLENDVNAEKEELFVYVTKNGENFTFPFEYIEDKFYYEECSFVRNMDRGLIKYLFIIPLIYLFTVSLVVCYICKYKKVKDEYEKLRNSDAIQNE